MDSQGDLVSSPFSSHSSSDIDTHTQLSVSATSRHVNIETPHFSNQQHSPISPISNLSSQWGGKRPGISASASASAAPLPLDKISAPLHVIETCAATKKKKKKPLCCSTPSRGTRTSLIRNKTPSPIDLKRDITGEKGQNEVNMLVNKIDQMLKKLEAPPSLDQCCIYRVPKKVRKVNKKAYTPHLVSIGPFHHDNEKLKSMDQLKKRFMERLVRRSGNSSLKSCIEFLKEWEERIRVCYSERIEMVSDEFVEMILVDGCFIVELLNSYCNDEMDPNSPLSVLWALNTITLDLILLENQIPFFVLKELFTRTTAATTSKPPSFLDLSLKFFGHLNKCVEKPNCESVEHFTDLVLTFYRPPAKSPSPGGDRKFCCDRDWVLSLFRSPAQSSSQHGDKKYHCVFSSTELDQAGVKFKCISGKSLFDIRFTNGVLQIPSFTLDDNTETQIRNIMALELCHYSDDSCVTDYMFFMDRLINTTKDVDLLVNKEIIVNYLGDSKAVANHFNNLCINVTFNDVNFHFSKICKDLNAYYKVPCHSWKASLMRNYFCTPWRAASTIAAVMLLVLTFVQTCRSDSS